MNPVLYAVAVADPWALLAFGCIAGSLVTSASFAAYLLLPGYLDRREWALYVDEVKRGNVP